MSSSTSAPLPSRVATGIAGLDDILDGGFTPKRLYLIEGTPGSGKTTLAMQFLLEGLRLGERCLYVTLSETADELRAAAIPLVGLHPGAKVKSRRWPAERFAALADILIERYGADIVLTGSAAEQQLTASVRRAMHHTALDLAGETDLGALAAVIARLNLLVSNDTGAAHMAAAVGTPSVVIFGPGRPEQWGPLDHQRHRIVDAWILAGQSVDPVEALQQLPVEPVLEACEAALQPLAERHAVELTREVGRPASVAHQR